jgi:type I site-specific deoxyribonuclease, HsdR family
MTHWNEETYVEIPFCQELEKIGWSILTLNNYQTPAESQRETFRQVIIEPELRTALTTINPFLEDDQITELVTRLQSFTSFPLVEKNKGLTELLIHHTTVHENRKDNTKSLTVKYIDFDNIHNNRFLAIRQFKVAIPGTDKHIIPDIILFVNGIPLVVVECKYTDINEPIPEAITQIFRYQDSRDALQPEGNPLLFVYNLFSIVTTADIAKFGTVGGKAEHYLEWKDPYPVAISSINPDGRNPDSQQILIHGMLRPDHLLDLLQTFTVFKENDQGKDIKIVSRYQQFRAVRKIIERLKSDRTPREKGGVVWHTQGSGKSLTMSFVIRAMKKDDELRKYKIVLITDRTNLDTQLGDSAETAKSPLYRANSIKELKDLIKSDSSNTIMAMMQKFQEKQGKNGENETLFPVLNESDKILLLIDEAHRTQASVLGANVERAMPNCTRIAFTGTPIMKVSVEKSRNPKRKTTTGLFGEYIDRYTIEQSIEDGSTLQIIYEGRTSKDFIRPAKVGEDGSVTQLSIDDLFEDLFKDHTPEEKEAIKQKYGTYTKILEAQERINRIAKDLVHHYRTNILPNKFKAQVVASTRLAAVRYKQAIDEAIQEEVRRVSEQKSTEEERELLTLLSQIETDVIISGGANDDPIYHPYTNSVKQEIQITSSKTAGSR